MKLSGAMRDFYAIQLIKLYLDQYRGISRQGWYRVMLTFINDLASGMIFFLPIYFIQFLNFNVATSGAIISCHGVGKALGGYLGGKLTEVISPDKVVMYCLLIDAAMYVGLSQAESLFVVIAIVFILGITAYIFTTANKICVLASATSDEVSQIKLLSVFYSSSNLGIGLSAIIISYFSAIGFKPLFLISSLILIISCVTVLIQSSSLRFSLDTHAKENADVHRKSDVHRNAIIPYIVLGCLFFTGMIVAQLGSTYPIYLSAIFYDQGINAVSKVFILNSLLILFFQTPVANYFGRFNKISTIGLGALLIAGSMSLLIFTHSIQALILTMLAYTLGEIIFFSYAQFVIYQHSEVSKQARNMGLYQSVLAISMIVGPAAGGYMYYQHGSHFLWAVCGIVGLFCLSITMNFRKC